MSAQLAGMKTLYRDERSGSDGVIWEPLILASFVVAATLTGASSPISTLFAESEFTESTFAQSAFTESASGAPQSADTPAVGAGAVLATPAPAAEPTMVTMAPVGPTPTREEVVRPEGRALIQWWDEDRWESRDEDAAAWRRDWLRMARNSPERVPLELWVSILDWAPQDRALVRSASRAARAYSSRRRRSASRASADTNVRAQADVIAEINDAVRAAERRSDYEAHKDDGPDSSWYRSLLRRIRGGNGGPDLDRR